MLFTAVGAHEKNIIKHAVKLHIQYIYCGLMACISMVESSYVHKVFKCSQFVYYMPMD